MDPAVEASTVAADKFSSSEFRIHEVENGECHSESFRNGKRLHRKIRAGGEGLDFVQCSSVCCCADDV